MDQNMHRQDRSKSAGHITTHSSTHSFAHSAAHGTTQKAHAEDIRSMCKKVAPYMTLKWRDVCEDLGVAGSLLDQLETDSYGAKLSDVAFRGLSQWFEKEGGTNRTEQLMNALETHDLRRAQEELRTMSQKNVIPIARPMASLKHALRLKKQDFALSRHARQQEAAERLSRPKSSFVKKEQTIEELQLKNASRSGSVVMHPGPTGHELCELKLRITVRHVTRIDPEQLKQAGDDFQKVRDDYKHLCHTFVRFVHENTNEHLRLLKKALVGFSGISVRKLTKVGFNIYCILLCTDLGAFEILHQAYKSGRLRILCQQALVKEIYLRKLHATEVELSVAVEEGLINKCRDILLVRSGPDVIEEHPADDLDLPTKYAVYNLMRHDYDDVPEPDSIDVDSWLETLQTYVEKLQRRYDILETESPELLITLRILRPVDIDEITSLQDVIEYFTNLRPSSSLNSGIRTDLIREYLAIVNQIRLKVEEIHAKDINISFVETLTPRACQTFHKLLAEMDSMLEPTFLFREDHNKITQSLTVVERETFGRLLCYIPSLIDKLIGIGETLAQQRPEETEKEDSDVIDDEGRSVEDVASSVGNGTSSEELSVIGSSSSDSLVHVSYTEDGDIKHVSNAGRSGKTQVTR